MKNITIKGVEYAYKNDCEIKYLERHEKDKTIVYFIFTRKDETHEHQENLPTFGRQEFIDLWEHLPKTGC